MPKISIIMPTYKVEKHIASAIKSVISQTFSDWELIVVDDGSPDDSKKIAEEYAAKDSRIRVVSKLNGGLSSARNFGLQFAFSEYIHFFDSDDRIKSDHYEKYLKSLESEPDIVISGYNVEYIDEHNNVKSVIDRDLPTSTGTEINVRDPHDVINFVCYAWNKLFRREFIVKHKLLYEEGLSRIEDAEFMSRAIAFRPKVYYIREGGYVYEQRNEISLSKGFDVSIIDVLKRRIDIDKKLISYFNCGLSEDGILEVEKRLNASALRSAVNRLFDSSSEKAAVKSHLKQIKCKLFTSDLSFGGRHALQKCFDMCICIALKYNMFFLIKILQRIRR